MEESSNDRSFYEWIQSFVDGFKRFCGLFLDVALNALRGRLAHILMEQVLAAASCAAALILVLATVAAGWVLLWHTTLKEIKLFREVTGVDRPTPVVKAQRQALVKAEIEKIKRQHSRPSSRSAKQRLQR